ncbi:MAG: tRNA preQ1(34) S-adenosylmethionine ribosyltransferase-isomerase QueA [Candidatus Omnitrophota bacterium]|jgi:S-adenosylmethionine:tRNA ribosyltransferase-isomerase|nr:MAG: tRNA preQ1(34) S-adenosylmethionine ribosyltransferase-isomerase QueA [Candidatus Omnitrophota bacterium]
MRLTDFDYHLPKELIAQYPLKDRKACRLLVLDRNKGTVTHGMFKDFTRFFSPGDALVLNDTKVLSCRLIGKRATGGKVELLLLRERQEGVFEALIKPGRLKAGETILLNGGGLSCEIISRNQVRFIVDSVDQIYRAGVMPLPPYIKRIPEELDAAYYQTVYAKNEGAIAAPTAGLHFTEDLLEEVTACGIKKTFLTLHINAATFKPVKAADVITHQMEREYYHINKEAIRLIEGARKSHSRIIAVGTTSCRAMEAYAASGEEQGYTDLFIYPGYTFRYVDTLLTNFHLPCTTLFILVCAFAGSSLVRKAYKEAVARKYRFYSYGDAMLIL